MDSVQWPTILLMLFPGALTVYFAFNSGGMFPVTTCVGALAVAVMMLVCVARADNPIAGLRAPGVLVGGLLALFALWTLLSASWSPATGRTLVAFDRVLLYLLVLVLFACVPCSGARFRWMLRGLLVGCTVVAAIGLLSRVVPSLWPTKPGLGEDRLSYPLTYWNTFALLAGVGCILALHHTSDEHEPRFVRALAAAALPLLAATLLLTFSRGGMGVTVIGAAAYIVVARPRGLLGGMLAAAPSTALAVLSTYSAVLVQRGTPVTPEAIAQGRELAVVLVASAAAAAVLRTMLLPVDERLRSVVVTRRARRRAGITMAVGLAALVLLGTTVFHGPSWVRGEYGKFVNDTHNVGYGQRSRLLAVGNDGRLPLWHVALAAFDRDPLKGAGAGTFRLEWERNQSGSFDRVYAYSLYLEVLGELGVVGACLLGLTLLTLVGMAAARARGTGRELYAAAFAVMLAWLLQAGLDLAWQTPGVTVLVFAIGGLALAHPVERPASSVKSRLSSWGRGLRHGASGTGRPLLALGCIGLGVVPARTALAEAHLRSSAEALDRGACVRAEADAHQAISWLDTGARPYEVLAMCAARRQDPKAFAWARAAVVHDRRSWEPHYVLALVQGAAGVDPRAEARIAYAENPSGQLPRLALVAFRSGGSGDWMRAARVLPFSFD